MRHHVARVLSFFALLLLGSGALPVSHVAIFHGGHFTVHGGPVHECGHDHDSPATPEAPEHDECPVCQVLASTGLVPIPTPTVVGPDGPTVDAPTRVDARVARDDTPRRTRGPPARA